MKNILVAIDFSDVTPVVIDMAIVFAKAFDSRLHIIHTELPEIDYVAYGFAQTYTHIGINKTEKCNRNLLEELTDRVGAENIEVESHLLNGNTSQVIADVVTATKAELVIVGTHEHGAFYHVSFGNTKDDIVRSSKVPVLVVPNNKA